MIGFLTSFATTLPNALSAKLTITLPPSIISLNCIKPGLLHFFAATVNYEVAVKKGLKVKPSQLCYTLPDKLRARIYFDESNYFHRLGCQLIA